ASRLRSVRARDQLALRRGARLHPARRDHGAHGDRQPADRPSLQAMTGGEPAAVLIARLAPAITGVLATLEYAARHVAPDTIAELGALLKGRGAALDATLAESHALDWPERWAPVRDCLEDAATKAATSLAELTDAEGNLRTAWRALRLAAHATE